jgi:tRNA(His) guanylyltransferase
MTQIVLFRVLIGPSLAQGTVSSEKHEILFSRFGINYNTVPSRFRKGSVLVREKVTVQVSLECWPVDERASQLEKPDVKPIGEICEGDSGSGKQKERQTWTRITLLHCDIIGDEFWDERPYILEG